MHTDQHMSSGSKQQLIFISTVSIIYPMYVRLAAHELKPTYNDGLCEKRS